jgi:hypothetical protein
LPRDDLVLASAEQKTQYTERQAAWEDATRTIRSEIDALLSPRRQAAFADALEKFQPDIRAALEKPAQERSCMERQLAFQAMKYVAPKMAEAAGKNLKGEDKERYGRLAKQLDEFEHLKPDPLPAAMGACDASSDAPPTFRLVLGDYHKPAEEVQPGFPKFLGATEPAIEPLAASSGRRSALAAWLSRGDHPLTARVMVNRLWQHHFGAGIVATPNDFGAMGAPPSHPELLDWLAVEFVEQGWSLKAMHRLMVTSAAYRQSSRVDFGNPIHARAREADAGNRLLWHARRRRLSAEAIRDSMLRLSGELNERMFGASARPELPPGVAGKAAWEVDANPADRNRRSIYILAKRNLRYPLLEIFDLPDLHNSCPERGSTTTAPQALALLNGEFALARAGAWSGRLVAEHGQDAPALARAAMAEAFTREPREEERRAGEKFLAEQTKAIAADGDATTGDAARAAAIDFCHAILNANEFLYVD